MYSNTCIFCGQKTIYINSENFNPLDQRGKVESVRSSIGLNIGSDKSSLSQIESESAKSSLEAIEHIYPVRAGKLKNFSILIEIFFNKIQSTKKSEFDANDLLALECVNKRLRKISSKAWNALLLFQNSSNNLRISSSIEKFVKMDAFFENAKKICLQIKKLNISLCVNDQFILESINKNYPELLELLLDSGANVEARNAEGLTILMLAAKLAHTECMRAIMRAGADLEKTVWINNTPTSAFSLVKNRQETGLMLIEEMRLRGILENCSAINCLLDIPVELGVNEEATPLMYAAGSGNASFVRALIRSGANVDSTEPEGEQTALMWAAYKGHHFVVHTLLIHGAAHDLRDKYGSTALSIAKQARSDLNHFLTFLAESDEEGLSKYSDRLMDYDSIIQMLLKHSEHLTNT